MCEESQTFLLGVMGPLGARKSSSSQNRCSALTQSDKLSSHPVYVTKHYNDIITTGRGTWPAHFQA